MGSEVCRIDCASLIKPVSTRILSTTSFKNSCCFGFVFLRTLSLSSHASNFALVISGRSFTHGLPPASAWAKKLTILSSWASSSFFDAAAAFLARAWSHTWPACNIRWWLARASASRCCNRSGARKMELEMRSMSMVRSNSAGRLFSCCSGAALPSAFSSSSASSSSGWLAWTLPPPRTWVRAARARSSSSSTRSNSSSMSSSSLFGHKPSWSCRSRVKKCTMQKFSTKRLTSSVGKP